MGLSLSGHRARIEKKSEEPLPYETEFPTSTKPRRVDEDGNVVSRPRKERIAVSHHQ